MKNTVSEFRYVGHSKERINPNKKQECLNRSVYEQSDIFITEAVHLFLFSAGRRLGKTIVVANKDINMWNEPDKEGVIENDEMDQDLEQPVQKKLRQDCPESSFAPSIDT
jgi:hypothetical protein